MDLALSGKAAVITGGASGIGLACAGAFAAAGARVAALDRDLAAEERVLALAPEALFVAADVRDEAEVGRAVEAAASHCAGIDVLVVCAGISGPFGLSVEDVDVSAWDEVMEVNVRGAFLAVKHCLPHLRRSKAGAIVLLASDSSFVAAPGMAPYCASKGALLAFARALSVDLSEDGIRVNCVCPSVVDTPLARADLGLEDGFANALFPVHTPEQIARYVLFLASPASETINGAALVADFGHLARSSFPA